MLERDREGAVALRARPATTQSSEEGHIVRMRFHRSGEESSEVIVFSEDDEGAGETLNAQALASLWLFGTHVPFNIVGRPQISTDVCIEALGAPVEETPMLEYERLPTTQSSYHHLSVVTFVSQAWKELHSTYKSADNTVRQTFERSYANALEFAAKLPSRTAQPFVSAAEDGELVLEWVFDNKRAIVSFEGDGKFGYTLLKDGAFVPGTSEGDIESSSLPKDLLTYIR